MVLDILANIQTRLQRGGAAERRLAAIVVDDLEYASRASIAELASRAGVSEPTVTRFCRSLGCDGMRGFKFHLAQALAVGGPYIHNEAPEAKDRDSRIVATVAEDAIAAIDEGRRQIDMRLIGSLAQRIASARFVLAFGSGGTSSMCASELEVRLFRLGIAVASHTDGQMQRMTASVATGETVLIGFSTTGFASSVVDAIRIGRQYGALTAAVTPSGSALAKAAETALTMLPTNEGNIYKPSSSRYAYLMLVDVIAMAVAEIMGPQTIEGMRRIRQTLYTFKINDPHQALGD